MLLPAAGNWLALDAVIAGHYIHLDAGPYALIALLLSTLATVGYLTFAATDEKYMSAILAAAIARPARDLALYGMALHIPISEREIVVTLQLSHR